MWKRIEKTLTSFRFVVVLILILIAATILGAVFPQRGAPEEYRDRFGQFGYEVLRFVGLTDLYHSVWYSFGLLLFSLSSLLCMVRRFSLRIGRLGFTLTHTALVVLAAGYFLSVVFSVRGDMQINEGESAKYFLRKGRIKDQVRVDFRKLPLPAGEGIQMQEARLEIEGRELGKSEVILERYAFDPSKKGVITTEAMRSRKTQPAPVYAFSQTASVGAPDNVVFPIDLSTLDRVELVISEFAVHGAEVGAGTEVLRIEVPAPEQGITLTSSGLALEELPFEVNLNDFRLDYYPPSPGYLLVLPKGAKSHESTAVRKGAVVATPDGKYLVTIKEIYPDYEYDENDGTLRTVSEEFNNPAVTVEVKSSQGVEIETTLFQKDPSELDRPTFSDDEPGFVVLTSPDGDILGRVPAREGEEVGMVGILATVRVLRTVRDFVIDSKTREVESRSDKWNNPAVQVYASGAEIASATFWVFALHPEFSMGKKELPFQVTYQGGGKEPKTEKIRALQKSNLPVDLRYVPGEPEIKSFVSDVSIIDEGQERKRSEIMVNHPLKYRGYTLWQSSYDRENNAYTVLGVYKDPGLPGVLLGCLLLCVGVTLIYTVNPILKSRRRGNSPSKEK